MKTTNEGLTKSVVVTVTVGSNLILILISSGLLAMVIVDTKRLLNSIVLHGRRQSDVW